ncbi:MAG: HsdR family type I site-specific deoxyribonuclease [Bacteroidetes bacterium]|nr:HsdR family type I site-specific deoxyribonuclease [Bacteroidota bacterium]
MSHIGKLERITQDRVIQLFQKELDYDYLGNWEEQERIIPVEEDLLLNYLKNVKGYSEVLSQKAVEKFVKTVSNIGVGLYESNKEVYKQLRYGVNVREELGEAKETVFLIDWEEPLNNQFGVAEEVTFRGKNNKRPDVVLYVNGIALGVLELKRSKVSVSEGIRQNLDNQKEEFIPKFFTTMQLVMAGSDAQGLRYGTIETTERYYLKWKEEADKKYDYTLDKHLALMCEKERILELIHDFIVFDKGIKKICRPNQYFGIKAAQQRIRDREGGILWHTQGSGKSLTMVWLTKWIRENVTDSRVLIITDREELDDQIEKTFLGVDENIHRTTSGRDLLKVLNQKKPWLICSLVHKFGRRTDDPDYDSYIKDIRNNLPANFKPKGDIYVFVDECHRTQSGKLNDAMKEEILPDALYIGYTGTPLLKKDKKKSIEVFGSYIGEPYRFDEAVEDGVVLDLLYEARDVEQFVTDQQSIDDWFDAETSALTDVAKIELKKKWGTMQRVLGSKARLEKIVFDIIRDFRIKPRLATGEGNAILVSSSVFQACRYYEIFQSLGFKKCAIITSYQPQKKDIKGEETGEENPTEALKKYQIYQKMLSGKSVELFEKEVKAIFIKEPGKMKLLIVVDKLLTGFDAPSATYLYIDKSMQDHGLFQAICRVNRVDTESKNYGYIIDYKDLFKSLKKSLNDYTSGAFEDFDKEDIEGLLADRYEVSRENLESALEAVIAICEPVHPQDEPNFIRYFCGDTEDMDAIKSTEERRVALYKAVVKLIRAYTEIANEMHKIGYNKEEANKIKEQVKFYTDLRETIKQASGDWVDLKAYEGGMRQLMDMYLNAHASKKISDFENKSLVELILHVSEPEEEYQNKKSREAVAETIENNVRKVIIEERQTNPKYFDRMSQLLDELIRQRKAEAIAYEAYLERIKLLAEQITKPSETTSYPEKLKTKAVQALYDNLGQNESMAIALDAVIQATKLDGWRDGGLKEKKLWLAVQNVLQDEAKTDEIMKIIKAQREY